MAPVAHAGRVDARTVLLADDDQDFRVALAEALAADGYDVVAVPNGEAALAALEDAAKPEHADMLLIALTGYGQATDRAASRDAGFDEHLVKPVEIEKLLTLLAGLKGARPEDPPGAEPPVEILQ